MIALLALAVVFGGSVPPALTGHVPDRTDIFALARSLYPAHAYIGGSVPTNHAVDHLIGSLHISSFDELGRHPDHGWLQAAVWQPGFNVSRQDGSSQHRTALITTAYVVSEYSSSPNARAAVHDLYPPRPAWTHVDLGPDGRIAVQQASGYIIIEAAFSQGIYDVEDLTMLAPGTPRVFYRTIRAAVLRQLAALQQISGSLDGSSA